MTFPRQRQRTLVIMAVFAVICALATMTCLGYYVGRRSDATPSTWRKRTSRVAIGRLGMSFVMLVAARRIRRSLLAQRLLRDAVAVSDLRSVEPLELLRSGVAVVLRRTSLV
ncbi:hypothetical protein [Mycobacterium montefiorense]|uniref:hypothetical protein n=1 Tax=Mycobacterium montefiorense TaxID=154654 RepID=UPI0021F2B221|nr:hypothetical protein [Mycobacterium montefiorense]MCV7429814.1 hypothetical protein [Mycobacterium montefiorense]